MERTPLENWIMRKTGISERERECLEKYQLERIQKTIGYAKQKSRFYREYLKDIHPEEIRSVKYFQNIPFTFPQQISANPFEFLCVPQSAIKRIVTLKSSGTSGMEKRIYFTEEDLASTVDFFKYGMSCLTDRTDRVMVLLPGNSYGSIGHLLKKALSETGTACFIHGVMTDAEETARYIIENDITCIVGIPIQVLQLARTKSDAFRRIQKVLLSTDYVPEILITELTRQYGCKVFTHYGMTEMGYGGGVECEARNGYHMREADLYFEIVDPVSGHPVPDGQWGEVVFTTLTRKAMPLIRYRTGDIAAFSSFPCACGTFLKTMKRVRGRQNNKIQTSKDKYLYLAELDEVILSFGEVRDYKVSLLQDGCIQVDIAADSNDLPNENPISESVQNYIHKNFGDKIELQISAAKGNQLNPIANSMTKRTIYDLRELGK